MGGPIMSEDNNEESVDNQNQPDPIKNLKSEFGRKQDNVLSELTALKQQLSELSQNIVKPSVGIKAKDQNEDNFPDPIVDPKGYKDYIKREISQEMGQSINNNNQRQAALSALVQQFPELQDGNADLTKKAVEYYNRLSNEEKMSPNAYKYAVNDAALDLGVVPMSKRQRNDNDDESFTGSSSGNAKRPSQKNKQTEEKLDPATLAFAQAIGKDINDPKYIESLKKHASRKNWSKSQ